MLNNRSDFYCLNMFLKRHNCYDEFWKELGKKCNFDSRRTYQLDDRLLDKILGGYHALNIIPLIAPWSITDKGHLFWYNIYNEYNTYLDKLRSYDGYYKEVCLCSSPNIFHF